MATEPSDNLLLKVDEFVLSLELLGYDEEKIFDAMIEYLEINEELLHA